MLVDDILDGAFLELADAVFKNSCEENPMGQELLRYGIVGRIVVVPKESFDGV